MMKRTFKRKQAFIFIAYFLILFGLIDYALTNFISQPEDFILVNDNIELKNYIKVPHDPSVCTNIEAVRASKDVITITYHKSLPISNFTLLLQHFALSSKWLNQSIFHPLASAEFISHTTNSITFRFFMPIIDEYPNSILMCAAPGYFPKKGIDAFKPHVLANYSIDISVPDFDSLNTIYSQIRCHNKETFPTRWCEFRNNAFFDHHFFFFSPAIFTFPEPFLVPGPRAPPFDKVEDRFVIEPIVLQFSVQSVPRDFQIVTDFCYIYGVFHNYYMLWHTIFDFMIPLYNFMNHVLKSSETRDSRRIYVRSDGVWSFYSLMRSFSKTPIQIINDRNPTILMLKGTYGIEKLEMNPDPGRSYDDSLAFQYNFRRETALGMREEILNELKMPLKDVGEDGKPLVLLIDRGANSRNIQNIREVYELLVETCPHCKVESVKFHNMEVEEQIRKVSRASALIGFHGSGLAHVVWMQASRPNHPTFLLEVNPYKYGCRNWYHTAADVAGVNYSMVMNKRPPMSVSNQGLIYCWNNKNQCATLICHDMLRDQPTRIEIDTFNETWFPIMNQLKSTIVNKFDSS